MRRLLIALVVGLALATTSGSARAHGMRTALVEIVEQPGGDALVTTRSTAVDAAVTPTITGCTLAPVADGASALHARCPHGLAGATISIAGLGPRLSEAVVTVSRVDGARQQAVLTSATPTVTVRASQGRLAVAERHVGLGLRHILSGVDHLLFLLLLVLYARDLRTIVVAESAFALSHALTFSATALGWLRLAAPPAEAAIALSLVMLALDVGRPGPRPTARALAALAFAFGAIHGLGFAGGLRDLGVPDAHAAWALVGFGLGVELGQLAFVLVAVALFALLRRARSLGVAEVVAAYAAGSLATWWFVQRTLACFYPEVL